MKSDSARKAHLAVREFSIPAGGECVMEFIGWTVFQVRKGTGYYLQPQANSELETGVVFLVAEGVSGSIRASQLGPLTFIAFSVVPARLTGVITLHEQQCLANAAAQKSDPIRIFSATSPVAEKMSGLEAVQSGEGLRLRITLLDIFVETVRNELMPTAAAGAATGEVSAARIRLQTLLQQMPAADLLEMNFSDLARKVRCTTRHLSRIFQELVGMSFCDKRAELRLARARELLAHSNAKVVDVALESCYKSLSLFNLMFVRRYGISPGKWRQKNSGQKKVVSLRFQRGSGPDLKPRTRSLAPLP